ncbi:MAG: DUF2834 domain-containing protein [Culicoidibacterales bacterium]
MMKNVYAFLAIIGAIVPNAFIVAIIVLEGGFDSAAFLQGAFANFGAQFVSLDLLLTVLTFLVFVYFETKKHQIRYWWLAIAGILLVGACFAFPFFLYLRERTIEKG